MLVQLAFAAITLLGYVAGYASEGIAWLTSRKRTASRQKTLGAEQQTSLIDWQMLELCKRFTLQVSPRLDAQPLSRVHIDKPYHL